MRKIRYALIGFGGIAENRLAKEGFGLDHARFEHGPESAELTLASDQNPARQAAAEALGLSWAASAEAVLADDNIDAVVVATNNLSHAPIAKQALAAGKHVFVEKPAAATAAAAREILALAREKKLACAVDHMMVENAWNRAAREAVRDGRLGTVNDAVLHMEFAYGFEPAEAASWRCSRPEELGGPIGDVASHCFYMAEFLLDSTIRRVKAAYLPKILDIAIEDGAYIKFELVDGRRGSVKVAFSEPRGGPGGTLTNLGYEIYGDRAALRAYGTMFQLSGHPDEPIRQRVELDDFGTPRLLEPGPARNIYQWVIERHARSILDGRPWIDDGAAHNLDLCEASHASARSAGAWREV